MDNRRAISDAKAREVAKIVAAPWESIKADAEAHFQEVQKAGSADGDKLWSERTVRDGYNAKVMEWAAAERRVRQENRNALVAVVGIVARIENPSQWEAEMAQINAGRMPVLEARVIEEKDEDGSK